MKKRVDLVVCAYNEEAVVDIFFTEVKKVIDPLTDYDFRIIVVKDGSNDNTLDKLVAAHHADPRVVAVDLSRNFGHEAALSAGLLQVTGDAAIVMEADLEAPPSLIPAMLEKWQDGSDVVNAQRISRKEDTFLKRWTAKRFYQVINSLSGKINIPENVGNYRLITRKIVDLYNNLPEKNRVFRVLISYMGFSTAQVTYARPKRPAGDTHYNWNSMTRVAVDGITSATIAPLKFAINAGTFIAAVLFIGGIQLLFLGVLGEYLGRIFIEVKARPVQSVKNIWRAI